MGSENGLRRAVAVVMMMMAGTVSAATQMADSNRGLWVGQATLNYVTEVVVPLDEDNIPRAPEPTVPTPTSDQAHILLILHVNGAGQASLLKEVAILSRSGAVDAVGSQTGFLPDEGSVEGNSGNFVDRESDLVLVTDERLYGEFPEQPAKRIASAVFDFGDSRATQAANQVIDDVAESVAVFVFDAADGDFATSASREQVVAAAVALAVPAGETVVENSDVATAFDQFLRNELTRSVVDDISTGGDATSVLAAAQDLEAASSPFYTDSRAFDLVTALVNLGMLTDFDLDGDGNPDNLPADEVESEQMKRGQNIASTYADLDDLYHGFLAGKVMGDAIVAAAEAAAAAAIAGENVLEAIRSTAEVSAAQSESLQIRVARYDDTRAPDALEVVLNAIRQSAEELAAMDPQPPQVEIEAQAEEAGLDALAEDVARYEIPADIPTLDYNEFVRSADFLSSAQVAAQAAAEAAVAERNFNPTLFTLASLQGAAKAAAAEALRDVLGAAARAVRTELPLAGLGFGQGDPRLKAEIGLENLAEPGGLEGVLFLPANHPTNPFRHRRHPDHTVGFDIVREIRLDFDETAPEDLPRAGHGVDRVSGVYREEIHGLHKPLGPDPSKPIGLKVEGRFVLNRISLIDQLNAR